VLDRRQLLTASLGVGALLVSARARLLRAQVSAPDSALPVAPIVSDALFHGIPTAFPVPPDTVHCTQACVYTAVNTLYQQEIITYDDIDVFMHFQAGRGTWSCSAVLFLASYIPNVHLTSQVDYGAALADTSLPEDVLPMAAELVQGRRDLYTYAPQTDADSVLDQLEDSLVLAHVNQRALTKRRGSSIGHAVLVYGNSGDILSIVDPDDERKYSQVTMDEFTRAFLHELILIPRNYLTLPTA